MSIRLRMVDGVLVALCAARSVEKPGDRYLDDGEHMALARKFWLDYPQVGIECEPEVRALTEREESENANREEWDRTFGHNAYQSLTGAGILAPANQRRTVVAERITCDDGRPAAPDDLIDEVVVRDCTAHVERRRRYE